MTNYEVYVDGAARGYGGDSEDGLGEGAAGAMFYTNQKLVGQMSKLLGRVDNDEAEYEAIYMGLSFAYAAGLESPRIYSDSERVTKQVNGEWDCDPHSSLYLHWLNIKKIENVYDFTLVKVNRKVVMHVDAMINLQLDALEKERERVV